MNAISMRPKVKCPHCRHVRHVSLEVKSYTERKLVFCDSETGGCDKLMVIEYRPRLEVSVGKVVGMRRQDGE